MKPSVECMRKELSSGALAILLLRPLQSARKKRRLAEVYRAQGKTRFSKVLERAADKSARNGRRMLEVVGLVASARYLERRVSSPRDTRWLLDVLPGASERQFKFHVRCSRQGFLKILQRIEGSAHFKNNSICPQSPVSEQLAIALMRAGMSGNGAGFDAAASKYGYSTGMIANAHRRVADALCDLAPDVIRWPNESERAALCELGGRYGFFHCFFTVDGSTIPLAFKPSFESEAFYDRKSSYSLNVMVTNDLRKLIINLIVGFPGSVHDARVLRAARYMRPELDGMHFTGRQHGLGDAAFKPSPRIIPPYKKPASMIPENAESNLYLARLRIYSEHTIGMLKGRFQSLKELRFALRSKRCLELACKHIVMCCAMHNILLRSGDEWHELHCDSEGEGPEDPDDQEEYIQRSGEEAREQVKQECLSFWRYA